MTSIICTTFNPTSRGGEGYDWYYGSIEERDAQIRTPITDGAHDEPWIYRYKDIRNWWSNLHHDRIDGVRSNDPTAWLPGHKPVWFTEYGCAAIDKGTNQPNKFLDLKSSESSLPRFSDGRRDDLIQMQYLRAMIDCWAQDQNNPQSIEYEGPMVDMRRAFVWAWDLRPYPFFPNNRDLWSDGSNYARGHWLNGRTSARSLASVVSEICSRSGLSAFETSGLYGVVRGYAVSDVGDARSSLQPLMLRHGFDAVERDGVLVFRMRNGLRETALDGAQFAVSSDLDGTTVQVREAETVLSGRVRLRFIQADASFDVISEEAVLPDEETHAVAASEFNMVLTRAEGRQVAERWLNEARIARETVQFALPPSKMAVRAGDVISLPADQEEGAPLYRIDRVDQAEYQQIEAVRIDPQVYAPTPLSDELVGMRPFVAPVPVYPLFLDLPLITGDEVPHAPYIAASVNPWPGSVALYSSLTDQDYGLNTILPIRSTIGLTRSAMLRGCPAVIDRGDAIEVKLISGRLETVSQDALLSGANLAAIGDGSSDNWEVFQFRKAELIAPLTYLLSDRIRGQAGTDALIPDVWPTGSQFLLLNSVPQQIDLRRNQRRVVRNYRIGPAQRGVSDPSYRQLERAFDGNGLRPYAPAHLHAVRQNDGTLSISWVRRTRIDGDGWDTVEVPLGEESESYLLRVLKDGKVLREENVTAPLFTYAVSAQNVDGATGAFKIEVAQVSASYGAGLFQRIEIAPL